MTDITDGDSVGNQTSMADVLMRRSSPLIIDRPQDSVSTGIDNAGLVVMRRSVRSGSVSSPVASRGGASPIRLSRPRSNPRSRTPMRYESPIEANAFRIREEDEEPSRRQADTATMGGRVEGQRITIRPMAGHAVGTVTIRERGPAQKQEKSQKQGPSHRKIRMWNNENFGSLASELASGRGHKAAQALLLGQADAAKYRSIYNPDDHRSEAVSRFMKDKRLQGVREKFFSGDLPEPSPRSEGNRRPREPLSPDDMMNRIDARLRRILVKSCKNSFPASKVVDTFESFLTRAFSGKKIKVPPDTWHDLLLEPPTITKRKEENSILVKFCFDAESPTGGFNRLLLHGLCQYHGLAAASCSVELMMGDRMVSSRVLNASGALSGPESRLTDHIAKME